MDGNENRQIARDSLFVMAELRLPGRGGEHRIKVRNLSARGLMGQGSVHVARGASVQVDLRNIGWVDGVVAWVQDDRFGVAFRDEIDPHGARTAAARAAPPVSERHVLAPRKPKALRKI